MAPFDQAIAQVSSSVELIDRERFNSMDLVLGVQLFEIVKIFKICSQAQDS